VFDILVDRLCFEQLQPPGLLYMPRCTHEDCDPRRVEAFTGFYSREGESYHSRQIPQRLLTRVGINRQRMAVQDELLYAPMVLSEAWWTEQGIERACFRGTVWVDDSLVAPLTAMLPQITHLGSGSARGLGQVEVHCTVETASSAEAVRIQALQQRLDLLNTALQTRWQQVEPLCEAPRSCPKVFTVNLIPGAVKTVSLGQP
jgi:CRISPR-associated Csx10 family RAMP protein